MDEKKPVYKRVLIKISGEALAGDKKSGLDFGVISSVCEAVKKCLALGVEVGIVIGGGNFWRGVKDGSGKIERTRADHMGMLATVMNCLAVADVMEQHGIDVRVQTAIEMRAIAEPYIRLRAMRHLSKGRVVLFGAGTGNPYFSTDTAAVLRAAEIEADAILLAKNIDGVYSADPRVDHDAVKYDAITYDEVLAQHLAVMDTTATSLSMDNSIPVIVFELKDPENIVATGYEDFENRMRKTSENLITNLSSVRAGRANAAVLDQISVDYYGVPTPIQQLANISTPDPRSLLIQPWDKSTLKSIEKAILASELGINPQNDGISIRLVFPQLTEERRKELAKQVKKYAEEAKVAIRNIRRDAMDSFKVQKKNGEMTEDDVKIAEKDLQKITDDWIKEIDKIADKKEKELFEI